MGKTTKHKRYRHAEGKHWIEVRVKDPMQLFDVRDPAPFREKDLDDDFVEYIMSSASELSFGSPLKIAIYVESAESAELSRDAIRESIQSFFSFRSDLQATQLKKFVRLAQFFFAVGIVILVACLGIAQSLVVPETPGLMGIFREGLVIFGWVSVWKPIELILFDWYPLYEKLRLYRKLMATEIEIQFHKK